MEAPPPKRNIGGFATTGAAEGVGGAATVRSDGGRLTAGGAVLCIGVGVAATGSTGFGWRGLSAGFSTGGSTGFSIGCDFGIIVTTIRVARLPNIPSCAATSRSAARIPKCSVREIATLSFETFGSLGS